MKQKHKDFLAIQKGFFGGVFSIYLTPFKIVVAFFAIFGEMFRQMLICVMTPSEYFQKLQDMKFDEDYYVYPGSDMYVEEGEV